MKLGIVVPQGFTGEFAGWDPAAALARTIGVARQAETLGFESVWVFDHLGTFGAQCDEPTLEAFALLGALAGATTRVRLGPLVARAILRNPALLAKHVSTLDVISGGRMELGLGAASLGEEETAFGYAIRPIGERMAILRETLAIVRSMFSDGRATVEGERVRAAGAIDNPRGVQTPRIPILVGGNGRVTRRLAAEFADELNLDGPSPTAAAEALRDIRTTCEEAGRDPATLAVSVYVLPPDIAPAGAARVHLLAAYRDLGLARIMALVPGAETGPEALELLARDARDAGLDLA